MRNFPSRFLGALALFFVATSSVSAQTSFIKPRPAARAVDSNETASLEVPTPTFTPSGKVVANKNSPLTPGAEVSFRIVEENEPPVRVIVADTGELEVPGGLGEVPVNGLTSAQAEFRVKSYLEGKFYKPGKGTVQIALKTLPASGQKVSKVQISGKVGRLAPILFYSSDPKKLSEAILEAGPTPYSDLKKVKVTRTRAGVETSEEYDVKTILESGSAVGDFPLRDGDRIHVPARPIIW